MDELDNIRAFTSTPKISQDRLTNIRKILKESVYLPGHTHGCWYDKLVRKVTQKGPKIIIRKLKFSTPFPGFIKFVSDLTVSKLSIQQSQEFPAIYLAWYGD